MVPQFSSSICISIQQCKPKANAALYIMSATSTLVEGHKNEINLSLMQLVFFGKDKKKG